jgi:hypothetical protein
MRHPAAPIALLLWLALLPARQQQHPYVYQGTIETTQPKAGSFALITGVGMALRLVSIQTTPATRVASGTTTLALKALKPGDVVRAECHSTPRGLIADRIQRIPLP